MGPRKRGQLLTNWGRRSRRGKANRPAAERSRGSRNACRLGYQFIAYNPLKPKRYVVVSGMNRWASRTEWKLPPLSRYGLRDFFVYDLSNPTPRRRLLWGCGVDIAGASLCGAGA